MNGADPGDFERLLDVRIADDFSHVPGLLRTQRVILKRGPLAYKVASILYFGDDSGVKRRQLVVQTWTRVGSGSSYDFEKKAEQHWRCEDAEIEQLAGFLNV